VAATVVNLPSTPQVIISLATVISVAVVVSEEILVVIAMINTTAEATILAEVMVKGVASTMAEIKVVPINLEVATSNAGAEVAPMTVDALILLDKSVAR
jgi:metal-sulfur cluster biosynthetic enzyme